MKNLYKKTSSQNFTGFIYQHGGTDRIPIREYCPEDGSAYQELQNLKTKIETKDKNEYRRGPEGANYYTTKDGNIRYFHNKHGSNNTNEGNRLSYNIGATQTTFKSLKEMKDETIVPKSLGETDFYTNYVNALSSGEKITDPVTGNRYYKNEKFPQVEFEGDKHWNIIRFLIKPHYSHFNNEEYFKGTQPIKKKTARMNALNDIYKYFLYLEKGNREEAWNKANNFMEKNVDPVVDSKFFKWVDENFNSESLGPDYLPSIQLENVYSSNNITTFVESVLDNNAKIMNNKDSNKIMASRSEIEEILIEYNIVVRKRSPEEAKKIANNSIDDAIERSIKYINELESDIQNGRIVSIAVLKDGVKLPEGYNDWDPMIILEWNYENRVEKKVLKILSEKEKEENRKRIKEENKRIFRQ